MMGFFNKVKKAFGSSKNFKYLDDLIHSGEKEIVLDSDIVLERSEKSEYLKGIKLDVDDLIIDGNGHTINAKGKTRIFYCTGKNIIIKNIILKKADYGAIYNDGGRLTITKTTLTKNTAWNGGGAIRNSGELTITESTFTGNTAKDDGGAIYNKKGSLTITGSTLTGNRAKDDGGAICNVGNGSLNMVGCKILGNKSPNNIIFNESFMEVHNTKFNDNQSEHVLVNEYLEFNISIIDSEFVGNNVEKDVLFNNGKSCTIQKSIFENNLSRNITNKTDLTLISPKIKDDGQSILNDGYIFLKKSPNLESKIYGDGTVETDTIHQEGETFDFGYLDKKIHESKSNEIILNHDIIFENYESDYYEGGIELDIDDLVIDGNGHIIDGANKSRIFIVTGKNITLKNITFKNGVTHDNYHYHFNVSGGAIRINHNAKITIENCKFISNTSQENGGAIENDGELTIHGSTFTENTAMSGGAIENDGELTIIDSTLTKNTAKLSGGAIYNSGILIITESTLTKNTAKRSGGAIFNEEGALTITESIINNNTAQGKYGGGGAVFNLATLTITESTLTKNTAEFYGGAIFSKYEGELIIISSTLTENTAVSGGAIFNEKGALTITKSTFTENTAGCGGAIKNNDARDIIIKNCEFINNISEDNGGAIHNYSGELTINHSTLTENISRGMVYDGVEQYTT